MNFTQLTNEICASHEEFHAPISHTVTIGVTVFNSSIKIYATDDHRTPQSQSVKAKREKKIRFGNERQSITNTHCFTDGRNVEWAERDEKSVGGRDRHAAAKHLFCAFRQFWSNRYLYHYVLWKNDGPIIALSIIVDVPSTFITLALSSFFVVFYVAWIDCKSLIFFDRSQTFLSTLLVIL